MIRLIMITAVLLIVTACIANENSSRFLGNWIGSLRVMDDEIECQIEFVEKDGKIEGFLTIPLQGMFDFPLSRLKIDYPEISFSITSGGVTATFEGSKKTTYISGTFQQHGFGGLFHLVRGEKMQVYEAPVISGESDIYVSTSYGNLIGNLVVPEKKEHYPVAIIIAGSGPTDRDGNNPMMGSGYIYRNLAIELQKRGIASLRYDKRGIGASADALIREEDLRFDYYVNDVVDWVKKIRDRDDISSIFLIGHSQGSLLAILAAQKVEVDGIISIAGMGRPMADVLEDQLSEQPEPYSSEAIEILNSLRQGQMVHDVSKELAPIFRVQVQPFLLSAMRYNPKAEIAKLDIPILIIHGTTDLQVTVQDAKILHNANKKSQLIIIDNMNHVMRNATTDRQSNLNTYGNPELPFSEGFLENTIKFIQDNQR